MRAKVRFRKMAVLVAGLMLLVVMTSGTISAADKVRFGLLRVTNPVLIGVEKGFFEEFGIDIELVYFRSGAELVPSLSRGLIDVASTTPGAALYNSLASGVDAKIVSDYITLAPGTGSHATVVRKELLANGTIKSLQDVKGLTFAITAQGQYTHLAAVQFLEQVGLSASDVRFVNMPYPDMLTALTGGSIDVGIMVEPFVTFAEESDVGVRWINHSTYLPSFELGVVMYSDDFLSKADVGTRFMAAFIKSMQYMKVADRDPEMRAEVAAMFQKHLPLEDPGIYERMNWVLPGDSPYVNTDSLADQLDWYASVGLIPRMPDLNNAVDNSFVDAALELLQ